MIELEAVEATIRGISQALQSPDAQGEFLRGEISFLLNRDGITLLRSEPESITEN